MYKMLIVDDEYLVLRGIKETIDWNQYSIEIVGEASNGLDGFNLALKLKPDIIISDIKMPLLNGIELAEKLNKHQFDGALIILSGYSDFEYAKKAFENGVFSYVLKPIDNQELIDTVLNSLDKLLDKRRKMKLLANVEEQMPILRAEIIKNLLEGTWDDIDSMIEKLKLHNVEIFNQGHIIYGKLDNNIESNLLKSLYDLILYQFNNHQITTVSQLYQDYFVFITLSDNADLIKYHLTEVMNKYEEKYEELFSIGVSNYFDSLNEIPRCYEQAKSASLNKIFTAINTITFSDEKINNYNIKIQNALDIIYKKYHTNLTVSIVADELYVSESYLMHLFKDTLGMTFNECLTNYRIMMAKRLLLKGSYRINEIANLVGYNDVKYFGQVFKKIVGCTPSDFIKSHVSIGEQNV